MTRAKAPPTPGGPKARAAISGGATGADGAGKGAGKAVIMATTLHPAGYRFFTARAQSGRIATGVALMITALPTAPPLPRPAPGGLHAQAQALETAFIAEMLRASGTVRMSSGLTEGGDTAGVQAFEPFLAEVQARALMQSGGLGLTQALSAALADRAAR